MYTEQDLQDAVDAGVLSEEASTSFKAFVEAKRQISLVDEEAFRLVTGFNDIFVVIASVLLLVSVGWIGGGLFGSVFVALIAWLLSEIFIKRKQMALPAILLFFAFSIAAGMAAALFLVFLQSVSTVSVIEVLGQQKTNIGIGVALLFALIHWLRFRVPVAVAGTVAVLIAFIFSLLKGVLSTHATLLMMFVMGLGVFALAMWWDLRDPLRQSRNSDVAFWLHLLAAPLIVHPIFTLFEVSHDQPVGLLQATSVVITYILIAIISLCIDRRALMVSALGYVLYVFSSLLQQTGFVDLGFAISAFVVASALLILSIFWHQSRSCVLSILPATLKVKLTANNPSI
jgi:MFS family permease